MVSAAGGLITCQELRTHKSCGKTKKKSSSFFPPPSPKQGNIFISIRDKGVVIFRKKETVIQAITVA